MNGVFGLGLEDSGLSAYRGVMSNAEVEAEIRKANLSSKDPRRPESDDMKSLKNTYSYPKLIQASSNEYPINIPSLCENSKRSIFITHTSLLNLSTF